MRVILRLWVALACFSAIGSTQQGDCYSFLRGSGATASGGARSLSEAEAEAATNSRVCVMSFVQLNALRPLFLRDQALGSRLRRIDSLREQALAAKSTDEAKQLIGERREEIHALFGDIRELPSARLAEIADRIRQSPELVSFEDHSPLQAELFARWIQVDKLRAEGDSAEVMRVVGELRRNSGAKSLVDRGEVDSVEEATYFRAETLWTSLQRSEVEAALSHEIQPVDAVKWLVAYSRLPEPSLELLPGPDQSEILDLAAQRLVGILGSPRAASLREIDGVSGVTQARDQMDFYIGGGDGPPTRVFRLLRDEWGNPGIQVVDATQAFRQHVTTTLQGNSTRGFRLFALEGGNDGLVMNFGSRSIPLTSSDLATLRGGTPLAAGHPLSVEILSSREPLVIYSHPLMTPWSKFMQEAEDFAVALKASYPGVEVVRDDFDPATTPSRVHSLAGLRVGDSRDLVAVVAGEDFNVDDKKAIRNLKDELRAFAVTVREWKAGDAWTDGSGRPVVVISGHIDSKMADFVRDLGKAGAFRGNYVVFGSCYSTLSSGLVQEINEMFGAAGTFRFQGNINAYDLADSVVDLARALRQGAGRLGFIGALNRSLKELGLKGLWTVCAIVDRRMWLYA